MFIDATPDATRTPGNGPARSGNDHIKNSQYNILFKPGILSWSWL